MLGPSCSHEGGPGVRSHLRYHQQHHERLYRLFALPEYAGAADAMKEELATYKARITLIRPLAERLDSDGKDTFDIQVWWRVNQAALPA